MDEWTEAHLDLLQNIEFAIAAVYRDDPDLEDWDASEALSAVIKRYTAERRGRPFRMPTLTDFDTSETADDRLRALKEVRASVRRHSKIHGRRGYLDFIVNFV